MPSSELTPGTADDVLPDDLVEVGSYATLAAGSERGLVILAMGAAYWLMPSAQGCHLFVESRFLERARDQIARYERESIGWPPRRTAEAEPGHESSPITPMLWALVVAEIFYAQGRWPVITERGLMDAHAVFDHGEWWRLATALFLHADTGHLISNALIGILLFTLVIGTFGRGIGWLLLAGASLSGNLMIAAIKYPADYRSLGASTAIFAGVGLLTGRAIGRLRHTASPHRWRAMGMPLAAGLAILGLYGAGGLLTDVGAHVAGFLSGLVFGVIAALVPAGR
jgi:rhomboid protease GluP